MVTQELGSSHPDKDKRAGVHVTVERPDLIFRAIKRDSSGELAANLLSQPLETVMVDFLSNKKRFHLRATINVDSSFFGI